MATKENISKSPSGRVSRTPINSRNVLTVKGKDPAYEYRIVNDTADRIQQFQEAGYEIENASNVVIGDKRVNTPTPEGTKAQVSVGKGDKAYLMKQRKEDYADDQAAKIARTRQIEATMKQEATNAGGKFEVVQSTKF